MLKAALLAALLVTAAAPSDGDARRDALRERHMELLENRPARSASFEWLYRSYADDEGLDAWRADLARRAAVESDRAAWLLLLGYIAERGGDHDAALALYIDAASREPETHEPHAARGLLLLRLKRAGDAAAALRAAIDRDPDAIDLRRALAEALTRAGHEDDALKVWSDLAAAHGDDPAILETVAQQLLEHRQFDEALTQYRRLSAMDGDAYRRVRALLGMADIHLKQQRDAEAIALLSGALQDLSPDSWLRETVRRRLEEIHLTRGRFDDLQQFYQDWIARRPGDFDMQLALARLQRDHQHPDAAEATLTALIERAPSHAPAHRLLADLHQQRGDDDAAIASQRRVCELEPSNAVAWRRLGMMHLYGRQRDPVAAEQAWRRIVQHAPDDPSRALMAAELFRVAGMVEPAIEHYRNLVALESQSTGGRERLARYLHHLGRAGEARKTVTDISDATTRARMLHDLGDMPAALAAIDEAMNQVGAGPEAFDLATRRVRIHMEQNDHPAASAALDAAERFAVTDATHRELFNLRVELAAAQGAEPGDPLTAAVWRNYVGDLDVKDQVAWRVEIAADLYARTGRPAEAVALLRSLVARQPEREAQYTHRIADLAAAMRDWPASHRAARRLIALEPTNAAGYLLAAEALDQQNTFEAAEDTLRQGARGATDTHALHAALAQRASEPADAIERYWRAFDATTDDAMRRRYAAQLATLHIRLNQFDRLVDEWNRRRRDPAQQAAATAALTGAYRQAGDEEAARDVLAAASRNQPNDAATTRRLRDLAIERGAVDEAVAHARRLTYLPDAGIADQRRLAELLADTGHADEAATIWRSLAGNVATLSSDAALQLTDTLAAHGLEAEARRVILDAHRRHPDAWMLTYRAAAIHKQSGRLDQAAAMFDTLLCRPSAPSVSAGAMWTELPQLQVRILDEPNFAPPADWRAPLVQRMHAAELRGALPRFVETFDGPPLQQLAMHLILQREDEAFALLSPQPDDAEHIALNAVFHAALPDAPYTAISRPTTLPIDPQADAVAIGRAATIDASGVVPMEAAYVQSLEPPVAAAYIERALADATDAGRRANLTAMLITYAEPARAADAVESLLNEPQVSPLPLTAVIPRLYAAGESDRAASLAIKLLDAAPAVATNDLVDPQRHAILRQWYAAMRTPADRDAAFAMMAARSRDGKSADTHAYIAMLIMDRRHDAARAALRALPDGPKVRAALAQLDVPSVPVVQPNVAPPAATGGRRQAARRDMPMTVDAARRVLMHKSRSPRTVMRDPEARYAINLIIQSGGLDAWLAELEAQFDQEPGNAALLQRLWMISSLSGRRDAARDYMQRHLDARGTDVEARYAYAYQLAEANRHAEAADQFAIVLRDNPRAIAEPWLMVRSFQLTDRAEQLVDLIESLDRAPPLTVIRRRGATAWLAQAAALLERGQPRLAIRVYRVHADTASDPADRSRSRFAAMRLAAGLDDIDTLIEQLAHGVRVLDEQVTVWPAVVDALAKHGRLAALAHAIAANPVHADYLRALARQPSDMVSAQALLDTSPTAQVCAVMIDRLHDTPSLAAEFAAVGLRDRAAPIEYTLAFHAALAEAAPDRERAARHYAALAAVQSPQRAQLLASGASHVASLDFQTFQQKRRFVARMVEDGFGEAALDMLLAYDDVFAELDDPQVIPQYEQAMQTALAAECLKPIVDARLDALRVLHEGDPKDRQLAGKRIRLLQLAGREAEAAQLLSSLGAMAGASPAQRLAHATKLAQGNDLDAARDVVVELIEGGDGHLLTDRALVATLCDSSAGALRIADAVAEHAADNANRGDWWVLRLRAALPRRDGYDRVHMQLLKAADGINAAANADRRHLLELSRWISRVDGDASAFAYLRDAAPHVGVARLFALDRAGRDCIATRLIDLAPTGASFDEAGPRLQALAALKQGETAKAEPLVDRVLQNPEVDPARGYDPSFVVLAERADPAQAMALYQAAWSSSAARPRRFGEAMPLIAPLVRASAAAGDHNAVHRALAQFVAQYTATYPMQDAQQAALGACRLAGGVYADLGDHRRALDYYRAIVAHPFLDVMRIAGDTTRGYASESVVTLLRAMHEAGTLESYLAELDGSGEAITLRVTARLLMNQPDRAAKAAKQLADDDFPAGAPLWLNTKQDDETIRTLVEPVFIRWPGVFHARLNELADLYQRLHRNPPVEPLLPTMKRVAGLPDFTPPRLAFDGSPPAARFAPPRDWVVESTRLSLRYYTQHAYVARRPEARLTLVSAMIENFGAAFGDFEYLDPLRQSRPTEAYNLALQLLEGDNGKRWTQSGLFAGGYRTDGDIINLPRCRAQVLVEAARDAEMLDDFVVRCHDGSLTLDASSAAQLALIANAARQQDQFDVDSLEIAAAAAAIINLTPPGVGARVAARAAADPDLAGLRVKRIELLAESGDRRAAAQAIGQLAAASRLNLALRDAVALERIAVRYDLQAAALATLKRWAAADERIADNLTHTLRRLERAAANQPEGVQP